MIDFENANLSGDYIVRQAAQILADIKSAASGEGLEIRFPKGTPSHVLTFNLRHIAAKIDKVADMNPEAAEGHINSAAAVAEGFGRLLDKIKKSNEDGQDYLEDFNESDLEDFYRREGLEPPDDETPEI